MATTNLSTINRNGNASATATNTIATTTSIEDLYKYFGILADAKDQAGKVILFFYNLLLRA